MAIADPPAAADFARLRADYRDFMEEHVYPNEAALGREDDAAQELIVELRARAKAEGLWAPHLPPEAGGNGRGFLAYAHLNEEIGRVLWAQYVFNCQAPDAGNGEILHLFGTEQQKERCRVNDWCSLHGVASIASTSTPSLVIKARHPTRIRERE